MNQFLERARVVLTSLVSWLVALAAVLAVAAEELTGLVGVDDPVVTALVRAVAVLGVIVSIVRRVTPVPPPLRGLTPMPFHLARTAPFRSSALLGLGDSGSVGGAMAVAASTSGPDPSPPPAVKQSAKPKAATAKKATGKKKTTGASKSPPAKSR